MKVGVGFVVLVGLCGVVRLSRAQLETTELPGSMEPTTNAMMESTTMDSEPHTTMETMGSLDTMDTTTTADTTTDATTDAATATSAMPTNQITQPTAGTTTTTAVPNGEAAVGVAPEFGALGSGRDVFSETFAMCTCDLTTTCDFNCCCDPDCETLHRQRLFTDCDPLSSAGLDRCVYSQYIETSLRNLTRVDTESESLFCVQKDNNDGRISFAEPLTPLNGAAFAAFAAASHTPAYPLPRRSGVGLFLLGLYAPTLQYVVPITFPTQLNNGGLCLRDSSIVVGRDSDASCVVRYTTVDDLRDACVANGDLGSLFITDTIFYLQRLYGASFDQLVARNDENCLNATTCNLLFDESTQQCHNAISKVVIHITSSLGEIVSFSVTLTRASLSVGETLTTRSGNPGYMDHSPVVFGIYDSSSGNIFPQDGRRLSVMTSGDDGTCRLGSRVPVTFPAQVQSGCRLEIDLATVASCDDLRQQVLQFTAPSSIHDPLARIGKYGNSFDNNAVDDFIEILSVVPRLVDSVDTSTMCADVIVHTELQIQYAAVGKLDNPQRVITGARYEYELLQVSVPCLGDGCDEVLQLVLQDTVEFQDVTRNPTSIRRKTPDLVTDLPSNFFEPFA